jgi:molybdopterin-guanine dinucleotide biosynthesis protein B
MKVFAVSGLHHMGKTTVVECLVTEFSSQGLAVGTIKDIHYEGFSMDTVGTNTWRHRAAGAVQVAARGLSETDFVFARRMELSEVVGYFDLDIVIIEGGHFEKYPRIACGGTPEEIDARMDETTFAISGLASDKMKDYRGLRVFNARTETKDLANLAFKKALDLNTNGRT